jgi:hypothetical protein
MLKGASYILALVACVGAAVAYPRWTGWIHTQASPSNYGNQKVPDPLPMIFLQVPVSPRRAPLWNPPGSRERPDAQVPFRWPWQTPPGEEWVEVVTGEVAADITLGMLALGLLFGWTYPVALRSLDMTAAIATGASLGIVLGWMLLLVEWAVPGTPRDGIGAITLALPAAIGAGIVAWMVWRARRTGSSGGDSASRVHGGLLGILWFLAGAMLAFIAALRVLELAEGLSRRFGWPLEKEHAFGTYIDAPALEAAGVMLGGTLLVIAWLRWKRGLRAYALGLGLPSAWWTLLVLS